jgi:predicted Mrr-cat superfamily restriction endonuclease
MRNIWLHRISHHAEASYPLIDKGFLTIGYSDFCRPEFLERTKLKDQAYFESAFAQEWPDTPRPRTRHNLWRFIAEMQVGDRVLIPSWGVFSVYRIDSKPHLITEIEAKGLVTARNESITVNPDGLHIAEQHLDLGFFRRVAAIATNVSRYDFADAALTSRMKIRSATADISDLSKNIEKALEAFRNKSPINLHAQILSASRDNLLRMIQNDLVPDKFEELIAWYFRRQGASEVEITSKNEREKQGDADIRAVFEPLKTIYYVQAKHHKGVTSEWAVQQVKEYKTQKDRMDDGYSKIAWVVSTAELFSPECVELAKQGFVRLVTGPEIVRMMLEAGIQNLDEAF